MKHLIGVIVGVLMLTACAQDAANSPAENGIKTVSMFYVGGQAENVEGTVQHVDHALVHSVIPDRVTKSPIIMYPGLGLSAHLYMATPDGREGWAQYFARKGHEVYVFDPVQTGPSGIKAGSHTIGTWSADVIWPRFGFGEAQDKPYDNARYPIDQIDQFYASWSARPISRRAAGAGGPRAAGGGRGGGFGAIGQDDPNVEALLSLLDKTGPAILMPHSMGGRATTGAIVARPDMIKGAVFLETVGCPDASNLDAFKQQPFLTVYGDYVESRGQTGRFNSCKQAVTDLSAEGADAKMMYLVDMGIEGNSHIFMQENNSDEIAAMVSAWIDETIE